jgi:CCR4-NOT transcription complex subunit 6
LTRDNIGIAAIFQLKDIPQHDHSYGRSNKTWVKKSPSQILVANTHIHWNPEYADVKLMQVYMLLTELSALCGPKSKWPKIPMVIAGDFNSTVSSGTYQLLQTGSVGPYHPELSNFNYGIYSSQGMKHTLHLSSAYAPIGEPPFTNYTGNFAGVLDYIFFTHERYLP